MSNSTPIPARGSEAAEGTGSTTDAADLFRNDTTRGSAGTASGRDETARTGFDAAVASDAPPEPATPSAPGAPEAPSAPSGGLAALAGDDSIAHVFDQTNGVIDRIEGDSDGTADSDVRSGAERADENPAFEQFADTEAPSGPGAEDPRATGN
jgi:hypothetical protein